MPRINLKYKSPEFEDESIKSTPRTRACDMPGCPDNAEYRAPKDRSLSEHYWFCQRHVEEYNRAWDFFDGMNAREVEEHILSSMFGDRPTWRYDADGMAEENLRRQAWEMHGQSAGPDEHAGRAWQEYEQHGHLFERQGPEFEALSIFGLEPPIDQEKIKARYKELAKKYHPDHNQGDSKAEELLKKINMAYTVLKLAFQKFEKIDKE